MERGDVVYGITTGFGAFKDKVILLDELCAAPGEPDPESLRGGRSALACR